MTALHLPDIPVLLFFVGINKLLLGILMFILQRSTNEINGIKEWAYGSIFTAIGFFIFAALPYPSTRLIEFSFVFSMLLFINFGDVLFLGGFLRFKGKEMPKWLYIFPILNALNSIIFGLVFHSLTPRFILANIINASLYIVTCIELFKKVDNTYARLMRINAVIYSVFALMLISRMIVAIIVPPQSPFQSENQVSFILFWFAGLSLVVLTYNIILIVTTKLNNDLVYQIESKNKLYSIISHDLRGFVNVFLNASYLLKKSIKEQNQERIEKFMEDIDKSALQSRFLLENLLNWSSSKLHEIAANIQKNDITIIIQQTIEILELQASKKNITIINNCTTPINALFDKEMMEIVIRNIISNAIKFTRNNGKIEISCIEQNNQIEIHIADNGVGMSDEQLKNLFDKRKLSTTPGTNNEKGSGIGLFLCKEFIEKNKGNLDVKSTIGKGTTFIITLPRG